LSTVAHGLAADVRRHEGIRRTLASARIYLGNNRLEKLQGKLDRAVQMLRFAQSCYSMAHMLHMKTQMSHMM
jgi:hypothetical protein